MKEQDNRTSNKVCSTSDFFQAYAQMIVLGISVAFCVLFISVILMFSVPPYQNWKATQSIKRAQILADAEIERRTAEMVEIAHAEAAAMGIIAIGESSASSTRADAIRSVGEAVRRYPEYARDQYLLSLSNALRSGDMDTMLPVPWDMGVLGSE